MNSYPHQGHTKSVTGIVWINPPPRDVRLPEVSMYCSPGGRDHGALMADFPLLCSCPGSHLYLPEHRGAHSLLYLERAPQRACWSEGQALRPPPRPDCVAALHYYGDKNKCATLFNWSVGPALDALLLVLLPSRTQRTKSSKGKGSAALYF